MTSFDWIWKRSKLQSGKWNGKPVSGPMHDCNRVLKKIKAYSALFVALVVMFKMILWCMLPAHTVHLKQIL